MTSPPVLPDLPLEVAGRVIDREGAPVPGAEVALFGPWATWRSEMASTAGSGADDGRDCRAWPLACSSEEARAEVRQRLDAGTLRFPEPLARTRTDTWGRYRLDAGTRDAVVVAWKGPSLARSDLALTQWQDLDLTLEDDTPWVRGLAPKGAHGLLVNPFTRQAGPFDVAAWDEHAVPLEGSVVLLDPADGPAREVVFSLVGPDGGLVDGELSLDFGPWAGRRTLRTDGGFARASVPFFLRGHCEVAALSDTLAGRTYLLDTVRQLAVRLDVRHRLRVRWRPENGVPAQVTVAYPLGEGISAIGGERVVASRLVDGGETVFDPLEVRGSPPMLVVHVERPADVAVTRPWVSSDGLAELSVELDRAPGASGVVVDGEGRAVAELPLTFLHLDGGYAGGATTGAAGTFAFSPASAEPLWIEASHPMLGWLRERTDRHAGRLTLARAGAVELAVERPDGGPLRGERVEVTVDQVWVHARTTEAGQLLVGGLQPGPRDLRIALDERLAGSVRVEVPTRGAVRASLRLAVPDGGLR